MLRYHYDTLGEGYLEGLRAAVARGEVGEIDPEITAWALMGMGELLGRRWILWEGHDELPENVFRELERIIGRVLETAR